MIVRKLKGLEDFVTFTSVHYEMLEKGKTPPPPSSPIVRLTRITGWRFAEKGEDVPGENTVPDPIHEGYTHMQNIYYENNPDYEGRFTVPTLYDKKQKCIVNNESSEIIRMFYHAFDSVLPEKFAKVDLLPKELEKDIDETNEWTYNDINNGVYKSGFAT